MAVNKRVRIEGGWASQMIQLIGEHGYNPGWQAEIMWVTNVDPLTFKASDGIVLESDDYIINADLLPKTETVKINGVSQTIEYPNEITVGEKFLVLFDHDSSYEKAIVVMKVN